MARASTMAALSLLLLLLLFPLSALADSEILSDGIPPKCRDDLSLIQEIDNLRSKFQDLEESSLEKNQVIHDKEKIISTLRTELENLKKEEILQHLNELNELSAKVTQLEEGLLNSEVELQEYKSKAKTLEAAQSMQLSKIKQLKQLASDQKKQIAKVEQALRAAEDWTKHCLPLVDTVMKKVSEKVSAAKTWSKPYFESVRMHAEQNWKPVFKRGAETVSATVSPYIVTAKSKVEEGYQASKDFITPQLQKIQSAVEPRLQVVKETCKPYVQEAAEILRPYYKQIRSVTKPYTNKISRNYRKFSTSVRTYHSQLQVSVKEKLHKIELLAPLASNELVWFLSAALLVLPVVIVCMFLSSQLTPNKKPVKGAKSHHGGHHPHKKAKRAKHVDK